MITFVGSALSLDRFFARDRIMLGEHGRVSFDRSSSGLFALFALEEMRTINRRLLREFKYADFAIEVCRP